jgi:hypothetical protein
MQAVHAKINTNGSLYNRNSRFKGRHGLHTINYLPAPPTNAIIAAQPIEEIKWTQLMRNYKVLRPYRVPLKVSSWQTLVLLALELTRSLVRNALPANPLPLLSTYNLFFPREVEKPSRLNQPVSAWLTNTSVDLGICKKTLMDSNPSQSRRPLDVIYGASALSHVISRASDSDSSGFVIFRLERCDQQLGSHHGLHSKYNFSKHNL